jgi:hypothetical protein
MKTAILKIINDPNFILNQFNIPFQIQFSTLQNFKSLKGLTGLYIVFDDTLKVTWYIGKSCSTGSNNSGGIYARIKKHIDRALGTYNKKHNPPMCNWVSLESWINTHKYPFINNGEVASIILDLPAIQTLFLHKNLSHVIDDIETQLILYSTLYSFCNIETYHYSRFNVLAPSSTTSALPITTLVAPIGMNASIQITNSNITNTSSFNDLFDIEDNLVFTNAEPGTKLWDVQDSLAASLIKT